MTRFVFLTDTHIGALDDGYHQQRCYAEHLPGLLRSLDSWIQLNGVDFVLHGGDVVDQVSPESIDLARSLFDLSVPVYVCLGNHDMTHADAAELWLRKAPHFFPGETLEYDIPCADAIIHVMPNHWCEIPYYWDWQNLHPHFHEDQLEEWRLTTASADEYLILCTHNEVAAVPMAQTGFTEPYHAPSQSFAGEITSLIEQCPSLRCVLSGHNHINTCDLLEKSGARAITASAFSEVPFEFKVFELEQGRIAMRTENLMCFCDFDTQYNYDKTFVQGRLKDRACEIILNG